MRRHVGISVLAACLALASALPHRGSPRRAVQEIDDLEAAATGNFESLKLSPKAAPDPTPASQHYFPSFATFLDGPPLGFGFSGYEAPPPPSQHRPRHIPYALQQANSFSQGDREFFNNFQQPRPGSGSSSSSSSSSSASEHKDVLGSGNYGVIRGGTFYEDDYDDFFSPYGGNNGHGRPSGSSSNYHGTGQSSEEQFANFRDFADITKQQSGAFSDFHVIYVNRNGSETTAGAPRNILEQLARLDEAESKQQIKPRAKPDGKRKLEAMRSKPRYRKFRGPKHQQDEPLLALS